MKCSNICMIDPKSLKYEVYFSFECKDDRRKPTIT